MLQSPGCEQNAVELPETWHLYAELWTPQKNHKQDSLLCVARHQQTLRHLSSAQHMPDRQATGGAPCP